jgi:two-component system, OmpR family, phosphate regulon response regulator PhoB
MAAILIVEDDAYCARLLNIRLEHAGHVVTIAADGDAALQAIRESLPDLIVLDLLLPRLNGAQLAQQLRHDPRTASIPILLVTALGDRSAHAVIAARTVDAVLIKPIDFVRFQQHIDALLACTPCM